MLKTIVFDLDNTLYNFDDYLHQAYSYLAREWALKHGLNPQDTEGALMEQAEKKGLTYDFLFNEWLADLGMLNKLQIREAIAIFHTFKPQKLRTFEGFEEMMESLTGVQKIILSDGRVATQQKKLKALGIEDYFDGIVLSDEHKTSKPDIELFKLIEREFKTKPEETLMVGDHPDKDILGAKKAGWFAVRFKHGAHKNFDDYANAKPDHTVTSLAELKNWLIDEKNIGSRGTS